MMKITHSALILCALTVIAKGWNFPLSDDRPSLPSSSNNLLSVSRISRQSTEADIQECSNEQVKAECSVAQKYINAFSRCGSLGNEFAINFENGCRRNSAGEYCRTLEISSFPIACQSGCSAECRTILTNGGCCFYFYMDSATEYFNACGLDIPSACPSTSLSIPTSSDDASCSSRDDFSGFEIDNFCNNGQPVYDSFISNDNCQDFARQIQDGCRYRDGKNCNTEVFDTTSNTQVNNAIANCPSIFNCSASCRSSLNDLNSNLGCCLNNYNDSLSVSSNPRYSVITDNALWLQCDITPPGICESTFTAAASSAYVTAGNIAFLVLASFLLTFV